MADLSVTKRIRYMVEIATPDGGWQDVDRLIRRARALANAPPSEVRFVRAIFVPEDSSCLLLYEAPSAIAATAAAAAVEFVVERVTRVARVGPGEADGGAPE